METRWVSVSDAAALETQAGRPLNKSSVSRFLSRNEDVPVKRDAGGRVQFVDYDALVKARSGSLAVQDSRAVRGEPAPAAQSVATPSEEVTAASRKRAAEAEMAEIGLAEKKGLLISRQAVQLAIQSAGVAFQQGLERQRRATAQAVAGEEDVRKVELVLKRRDREVLAALVEDLGKAAEGLSVTLAADEGQPA
jgi:hypothetical protein